MLPSLSSVKKERDSVTTLTVLFAGVGAILAQGIIPQVTVGDMRAGYRMVAILIAAVFIGSQVMTFFFVKETPRAKVEMGENISLKRMWKTIIKNDQLLWMTLSMLFYNVAARCSSVLQPTCFIWRSATTARSTSTWSSPTA
jgi:Na+/melibiose symporter-like transporter